MRGLCSELRGKGEIKQSQQSPDRDEEQERVAVKVAPLVGDYRSSETVVSRVSCIMGIACIGDFGENGNVPDAVSPRTMMAKTACTPRRMRVRSSSMITG